MMWEVNPEDDINTQWSMLLNKMKHIINYSIPQREVIFSSKDRIWMTPLTKALINEKWRAYRQRNWPVFNHLKQKARIEILKAKSLWAAKSKSSPYGLWKLAKHLSGKEAKNELHNLISQFKTPSELAEKIASVISEISSENPISTSCGSMDEEKAFYEHSCSGVWTCEISETEIRRLLEDLDARKAMGCDHIPNRIYSLLAPFIANPLKTIFETSISQKVFPSEWKKAVIVPIPKTNPPMITKLRTISLLPSPAKILEKLVLRSMRHKLEPLIGPNQHAFRSGASTTTALIQILDTATQIFDDVTFSGFGVINLDFSKVFDLVDHSTLLTKMTSARLSKNFIDWLRSYLSDRSYRVKIQGILSGDHKFLRGVPQGSVLGPALFSTLVGDLPYDKSTTVSYTHLTLPTILLV